ncbi:hypothetical protein EMCG_01453 [[Emmonsia] crescens]|uniref:Uncharacterized protein n=1 Tax=[Emmonsia] crescens TaxID=73230 RepID=A0A0G2I1H4_9EURO|nr:hypothetical protein EMCG_01453 [Emmonsia crescens UAMH 3008]
MANVSRKWFLLFQPNLLREGPPNRTVLSLCMSISRSFRSFTESTPLVIDSHESGDEWAFGKIGDDVAGEFAEPLTPTNSPPSLHFTHRLYYPDYIQGGIFYRSIMLAHA